MAVDLTQYPARIANFLHFRPIVSIVFISSLYTILSHFTSAIRHNISFFFFIFPWDRCIFPNFKTCFFYYSMYYYFHLL